MHPTMSDTMATNESIPDEMLEDGEIDDDDDDIVTEETEVIEETVTEVATQNESDPVDSNHDHVTKSVIRTNEVEEDEGSAGEDRRKSHKRHQRKRKRHRDSKEKDLKAEKKERRRNKRKLQAYDEGSESHEHGGSLSPHSKRRKKRKKHSRERRDSTTPDSDNSSEKYSQSYYGANNGYSTEYGANGSMYTSSKSAYRNSAEHYYQTSEQTYAKKEVKDYKDYGENSDSDFEAQLAEYQNYKTHGDSYSKEPKQNDRNGKTHSAGGEMYEEFMEYEENPKRVCKFFLEGKCLKGNECSFSHDQSARKAKSKKREICKYYLAGHCHHGDQCSYMHGDYPCKYFHTGVTCYAGENCRFSHEPATDETQDIVDNFKDVLASVDDSWEISELAKLGITVKPKPPPGVGLLPTPDILPSNDTETLPAPSVESVIPSIFDISVAPSAAFQKRINENTERRLEEIDTAHILLRLSTVASLSLNEMKGSESSDASTSPAGLNPINNGAGLLPTPNTLPINLNQEGDGYYHSFLGEQRNKDTKLSSEDDQHDDVIKTGEEFIRTDHSTTEDEQGDEPPLKIPDFLPATQKALFMRIHGKKVAANPDKDSSQKSAKREDHDSWTYSSDEDEKQNAPDPGIIKMDVESHAPPAPTSQASAMESLLKMISKGGNTNLDAKLLSKVASVINIPTGNTMNSQNDHYSPKSGVTSYNPAQSKASPRRPSAAQRERKDSGSTSSSPSNATKHQKPLRRRLSTQELTKEPAVIPLVAKQSGTQSVHSAHPDPRMTLSRLIGIKPSRFTANVPRFSKDLILPGSSQLLNVKVTLTNDDAKTAKRDPRLARQKDPRLQRASDPRLKMRAASKPTNSSAPALSEAKPASVPAKPSALLTKSASSIPSLPELDLNLAYVQQRSKENGDSRGGYAPKTTSAPTYSLPALKLPKLVKAPNVASSPVRDEVAAVAEPTMPKIAPYDPRYMSSGPAAASDPTELPITTAPYDPRVLSAQSNLSSGGEVKKRTIQLPKLTPAPLYKPTDNFATHDRPEGDQGDF